MRCCRGPGRHRGHSPIECHSIAHFPERGAGDRSQYPAVKSRINRNTLITRFKTPCPVEPASP
ncbi:hypothetical protein GJA_4574 [Janthinobacterium agaricidamnosum NBRC 102515 = DSM 9628]|uniref:Uncharacterized protein n=1 Tax=Janthinobacterium agaricidamnosum NBRC 102515 = DSM 9628 TaxID=1349767 RepID=W0VC15_9BURK|nr:hypothetical protein GJA_4574 [Janthinobacterium agaricidamnosum NBRC 102515 = DSM 9628]